MPFLSLGADLPASKGCVVSAGDEGARTVDDGLHPRPDTGDDVRAGAGRLILIAGGPAGHVAGGQAGIADHHGRPAGRAHAGHPCVQVAVIAVLARGAQCHTHMMPRPELVAVAGGYGRLSLAALEGDRAVRGNDDRCPVDGKRAVAEPVVAEALEVSPEAAVSSLVDEGRLVAGGGGAGP